MLKKDIIILGCIGIIILCLSKLVVDSYNAASNSGNQEKESIEENLSAEALQELSEKEVPESSGFFWDASNFAAEENVNISIEKLNTIPCYYFSPPNNMDEQVEMMAENLFGNTDNLNRGIEETFGDGWGNYYNFTCDSEEGNYSLSGNSVEMTYMRKGIPMEEETEDKIMQIQRIIDKLQLGIYGKEGNSYLTISQVHENRFNCSYVFNGIEASKYPYGESTVGDISSYGRLQPIEFEFKNNQISAIYHIISDKYESEEIIKSSYKGWDEILQDFKEEAGRDYKEIYGQNYGNRYISLGIIGMKCVYEGGFVNGKNARLVAVPAVEIYVVVDIYSFENENGKGKINIMH